MHETLPTRISAPKPGGRARQTLHILVAEDSLVTQDLLKLVLEHRGHRVEIASTGPEAEEALEGMLFDVVLMDFHLPGMSGVEVLGNFMKAHGHERRPHFVATTGDVEGLLSDSGNCEFFDRVLPKPIQIDMVTALIDELGPARVRPTATVAGAARRSGLPLNELGLAFLTWPEMMDRTPGGSVASGFDAILVTAPLTAVEQAKLWMFPGAHLLPVVDACDALGPQADIRAASIEVTGTAEIADLVAGFRARRGRIADDMLTSARPEDRLLVRIALSDRTLVPSPRADHTGLYAYNTLMDPLEIAATAQELCDQGFLRARFVDRVQICPSCSSSRFNVRETCPGCGSSHISDIPTIRHIPCGTRAPTTEFHRSGAMICPGCARKLRKQGKDFERGDDQVACAACGQVSDRPQVQCLCIDCGVDTAGERIPTRDILSYTLTERGRVYLATGSGGVPRATGTGLLAGLPATIRAAIDAAKPTGTEAPPTFSLITVDYGSGPAGPRAELATIRSGRRVAYLDTLRRLLGPGVLTASDTLRDYALMPGETPAFLRQRLPDLADLIVRQIQGDPGGRLRVFGPGEVG